MTAHRMAKTRKMTPLRIRPSSSMNSRTESAIHPIAMIGQPIRQALLDFCLFPSLFIYTITLNPIDKLINIHGNKFVKSYCHISTVSNFHFFIIDVAQE